MPKTRCRGPQTMVASQTKTPLVGTIAQISNLPTTQTRTNRRIGREAEAGAEAERGAETRAETDRETTHLTLLLFATDATSR